MVRFNASIYRNQKYRNTFLDCVQYLTHEAEKQQALGKHHYGHSETMNFDFRAQLVEREEMRLRYGQELSERDRIPLRSLIQRHDYSSSYRAKSNAYQNDSEKLDKFREIHYRDRPMPLMRINYYIYAEDEKLVQELERFAFEGIG